MTSGDSHAAALRRAFDESFAEQRGTPEETTEDFLLVRTSDQPFALRMAELGGVAKGRSIVSVPSRRTELLGLAGIRGAVICVYSMAALLGLAEDLRRSGWLALAAGESGVGLAFHELEGFLRAGRSQLLGREATSGTAFTDGLLKTDQTARPIVDVRAILQTVRSPAGGSGPTGGTLA